MSISAVGSSTGLGLEQMMGASKSRGPNSDEIAASIFEKDDADGDGLLSLSETPLDEDRFNSIDADGDGFLTQEELSQDAQSRMNEQGALMGQLTLQMQGISPSEMAASIVDKDDADGDGQLSLDETPLDEEMFNSIDANGDGFITADELSADMETNMASGPPAPPAGSEGQVAAASGGASQSSESSESEEDYDELDLNEDGVVSMDELLQAYQSGDPTLKSLFASLEQNSASSMTQRIAMEAYEAQAG